MLFFDDGRVIENDTFSLTYYNRSGPSRVVLSVPHDGIGPQNFTGLFTPRSLGWKGADMYMGPFVNDILQFALQEDFSIDAVRFLMARMYVDANREAPAQENIDPDTKGQVAYDDPQLARVYSHYHGQIDRLLQRSIGTFGRERVLLLDMHGFGKQPSFAPEGGYGLILGTANRTTVPYGRVDEAFAQYMEGHGYSVFLPGEKPVRPQGDPYSAGHITRLYAKKYSINAMQIEVGPRFRQSTSQEKGKQLARDIAVFLATQYITA